MAEMSDDEFMSAGSPPTQSSGEMSDTDFMEAKPASPSESSQTTNSSFGLQPIIDAWNGKNDVIGRATDLQFLKKDAKESSSEVGSAMIDPVARAGAIDRGWGANTPGTKKFDPSDSQDWQAMVQPFMPGAELPQRGAVGAAGEALTKLPAAAANTAMAPVRGAQTIRSGWNAMKPEELQSTVNDLQKGTNGIYTQMRALGAGAGDPEALRSTVGSALAKTDILPKLTPVTSDVVQQINDAADTGNISLNHLDQFRRQLKNASGEDSAAAGAVRKAIDNHVNSITDETGDPNAVALLNRGRAEYTRNANLDDVGTILQKANGDPTKIKNYLNTFLSDEDNTRGMLPDEIAALRRASQTSTSEMLTKMLGKAGFTLIPTNAQGNGVLPYVMMAGEMTGKTGAGAMVPGGVPLVAAGTVAKAGNTLYGRGLGQQAFDRIKNRPMPSLPEDVNIAGTIESPPIRSPFGGFAQQKRGGTVQKPRSGVIFAKPKSYPALRSR